jgi:hypothetical protein
MFFTSSHFFAKYIALKSMLHSHDSLQNVIHVISMFFANRATSETISFLRLRKKKIGRGNAQLLGGLAQRAGETPHVSQETPHEPQERHQVPQGEVHVPYSGEILAKSRAAFLAAGFVMALRNVPDLFHTVATCTMKV